MEIYKYACVYIYEGNTGSIPAYFYIKRQILTPHNLSSDSKHNPPQSRQQHRFIENRFQHALQPLYTSVVADTFDLNKVFYTIDLSF